MLVCLSAGVAQPQSGDGAPVFEAASVRLAGPNDATRPGIEGGPGTSSPGQWRCTSVALTVLIRQAWNVGGPDLLRGPGSMDSARYYIVAKVPAGASRDEFNSMLRQLLIERLDLKFHQEAKDNRPVLELVVAKGGPKMKAAEPPPADGPPPAKQIVVDTDGSFGLAPGYPKLMMYGTSDRLRLVARMEGIDTLAEALQNPLGEGVVDKTGLAGKYDFKLVWALPANIRRGTAAPDGGTALSAEDAGPTLEQALKEQLGLEVRRAKATLEVLVVDSFNKIPTDN